MSINHPSLKERASRSTETKEKLATIEDARIALVTAKQELMAIKIEFLKAKSKVNSAEEIYYKLSGKRNVGDIR